MSLVTSAAAEKNDSKRTGKSLADLSPPNNHRTKEAKDRAKA